MNNCNRTEVYYLCHPKAKGLLKKLGLENETIHFGRFHQNEESSERFLKKGGRRFVAIGGDGAVFDLMNGLFQMSSALQIRFKEIQLGAIAAGSSNDFHKSKAQIPALGTQRINFDQCENVDLLHFKTDETEFISSLNASIGFNAEANSFFNSSHFVLRFCKKLSTQLAILFSAVHTLLHYQPINLQLDSKEISIVNLGFIKSRFFAGGFHYPDWIQAQDGKIGAFLIPSSSRWSMLKALFQLSRGRFQEIPRAMFWSSHQLSLKSEDFFHLEINGEVFRTKQCQVQILPGAASLCPLL